VFLHKTDDPDNEKNKYDKSLTSLRLLRSLKYIAVGVKQYSVKQSDSDVLANILIFNFGIIIKKIIYKRVYRIIKGQLCYFLQFPTLSPFVEFYIWNSPVRFGVLCLRVLWQSCICGDYSGIFLICSPSQSLSVYY
jgi:hypothetical protein